MTFAEASGLFRPGFRSGDGGRDCGRSQRRADAQAAKVIKGLIGNSVDKVEAGSRLVGDAGTTMSDIVASVRRVSDVSDVIAEISRAASEQTEGLGQINTAIGQLDTMTQQNASLVEQCAAAAESMREQSVRLAEAVSAFRLHAA